MTDKINDIRHTALSVIERNERQYNYAFIGAAVIEVLFFAAFLLLADFSNRIHVLLLIATVTIYTVLAFGLIALGLHVNRNTLRVLNALETIGKNDE